MEDIEFPGYDVHKGYLWAAVYTVERSEKERAGQKSAARL